MKRLLRSLNKRSLHKEANTDDEFSPRSESLQRNSVWSIAEDEPWSYNRLKDDEAAEKSASPVTRTCSRFEQYPRPSSPLHPRKSDERYPYEMDAGPNPRSQAQSSSSSEALDPLQSIYGSADIRFFGSQYGFDATKAESTDKIASMYHDQMVEQVAALNFYEEMMRNAAPDIQRAASGKAETLWGSAVSPEPSFASSSKCPRYPDTQDVEMRATSAAGTFTAADAEAFWRTAMGPVNNNQITKDITPTPQELPAEIHSVMIPSSSTTTAAIPQDPPTTDIPTSCIICIEDFTPALSPPTWITLACTHPPSVCSPCLAKCIKNDLDNKIWNQIKCPECDTLLVYDDIKRLADAETFTRYEEISFRSAVGSDSDFIWCRSPSCGFGQLHTTGQSQPIVRCLKCGFRSCFKHGVPWHERLTCDEYDEMLQNPIGFKSALEREEEERVAEEERQRQRHEAELTKARAQQEAEAERRRQEAERRRQGEERRRQQEEVLRKQREEQASLSTVKKTTKNCPGCSWPIEKNMGCAHMTCTRCYHQFCWICLRAWGGHGSRC